MREPVLPRGVQYIIEKMKESGFRADIVGGCVRDFLLGRECSDYDLTTDATPDEIKAVFHNERIIETGIKHGTVTLLLDNMPYEITTYRRDGEYLDNRHPSGVTFTADIREDTARRDFTMNAVCYNPFDKFSDFHGGIADIEAKIIRAVGNPARRFGEDSLRIFRAIRFRAALGFEIEEETKKAIFDLSHLMKNLSRERILTEWRKLLAGEFAYEVIDEYFDVISLVIPGLDRKNLPEAKNFKNSNPKIRNISLFENAKAFEFAMRSLHSDTAAVSEGVAALNAVREKTDTEGELLKRLSLLGEKNTRLVLHLKIAKGTSEKSELLLLDNLLAKNPVYRISDLKIKGNDIINLGFEGEAVGKILSELLTLVMEGKAENTKDSLLKEVAKYQK